MPELNNYIKSIPKDQIHTEMQQIEVNGEIYDDWFRICNKSGISKILWYCWDNNVKYQYENVKQEDVEELEFYARKKKERFDETKKFKQSPPDITGDDYSFMKIAPYGYQKEAVRFFEAADGKALLGDQPGVGKSLEINELLATPNGWIRMADVKVGDKIFHHDGTAYSVTGVFPQGKLDSYRVTFNDDFTIECSMDHLWMVRDVNRRKRKKGWIVKTLKELVESGLHYQHNENRAKSNRHPVLKWEIPIVQPIQYPEQNYIIHPYILGAEIGDGYLISGGNNGKIEISIPNFQLETKTNLENVINDGYKFTKHIGPCPSYNLVQKNVTNFNIYNREIKNLKLNVKSGHKFIPKNYLIGSIEQRIELLQGLMDTDGSAKKNRINYHTSSKQLAKDVAELVQSLGGQAIIKYYNRDHENKSAEWRVNIRLNICPFKLEEKRKEWWPAKRNYASRYIKSVEYVGMKEHQCISVDSPDNTFVTRHYIVTHNTLSALSYACKHKFKTLVICPATLKLNWRNEINKFSNEKCYIFKYQPPKKERHLLTTPEESLIHIINYESLDTYLQFDYSHKCNNPFCDWKEVNRNKKYKICPKCFKDKSVKSRITDLCRITDKKGLELKITDYDLIVLDEAHYIKNEQASRTKIVKHGFDIVPRKILLTGTAIKSRPYEFFSLLNFLDKDEWINAHHFGVKYCAGYQDNFDHWHYDGYSNIDELYSRISYLFLRRLKSDILKYLPPKTYSNIPIELSPEELREYKKIEKGILDETQPNDDKPTHLARITKMKQFTSVVCAKRAMDFIQDIIDGDMKIVVFTSFLYTADLVYNHFKDCAVLLNGKKSATEKQQAVDAFMNDENIKVFVGTTGAAGVGITLTAANNILFLDQPWTPSDREQAEDRVHRASQTADNVQVIRLICQQTIDEDINELLNQKEKITSQVLDGEEMKKNVKQSIFEDLVDLMLNKKLAN